MFFILFCIASAAGMSYAGLFDDIVKGLPKTGNVVSPSGPDQGTTVSGLTVFRQLDGEDSSSA